MLANLGGYWSILAVGLLFADIIDDVQLYVVSDLVGFVDNLPHKQKFDSEEMRLGCRQICSNLCKKLLKCCRCLCVKALKDRLGDREEKL